MSNVFMVDGDSPLMPPLPGSPAEAPRGQQQFGAVSLTNGVPRFVVEPVRQADGTYVNVEFVDIMTPGDNKSMPRRKVTPSLIAKYRPWYDKFREGLAMTSTGSPLEMWPVMTPAQVQTLKALNIFTVEDLRKVPDSHLHNIPMGRTLRNQAEAWLEEKGKSDTIEAHRRENETMKAGMQMLEAQVAALAQELAARPKEAAVPQAEQVSPAMKQEQRPKLGLPKTA